MSNGNYTTKSGFSTIIAGAVVMDCADGRSALGRKSDGKFRGWGACSLTGSWRINNLNEQMVRVADPRRGGEERWLNVSEFRGRFVKDGKTIREYNNLF